MVEAGYCVMPSAPDSKGTIEDLILEKLNRIIMDEDVLFAIRLSLEEAVTNAIRHGNKSDPNKKVRVSYIFDAHREYISIEDDGAGFDLDSVPNPTDEENLEADHGRGILLMRVYMDEVRYNKKGNQATLVKYLNRDE